MICTEAPQRHSHGECSCGGRLVKRKGRYGSFVGCTNYPDCNVTYSLPKNSRILKTTCDKCGLPLISTGKGKTLRRMCLDPNCGKDKSELKVHDPKVVGKCPQCGKEIVEKRSRKGKIFFGCSGYPDCKVSFWYRPVDKKCPKCGSLLMERKGRGTTLVCSNDECGYKE